MKTKPTELLNQILGSNCGGIEQKNSLLVDASVLGMTSGLVRYHPYMKMEHREVFKHLSHAPSFLSQIEFFSILNPYRRGKFNRTWKHVVYFEARGCNCHVSIQHSAFSSWNLQGATNILCPAFDQEEGHHCF